MSPNPACTATKHGNLSPIDMPGCPRGCPVAGHRGASPAPRTPRKSPNLTTGGLTSTQSEAVATDG